MKKLIYCFIFLIGLMFKACTSNDEIFSEQKWSVEQPAIMINTVDTATTVSALLAQKVAIDIFNQHSISVTRSIPSIATMELVSHEDGTPAFYVVNYEGNNGFVLISATQQYIPVLAFSDKGHFDITHTDKIGVSLWMQNQKISFEI